MSDLASLLEQRQMITHTVDVADTQIGQLNEKISAITFPNELLDEPITVETQIGNFEVTLASRLEWNQNELVKLMSDPDCGPIIKERYSVERKKYDALPEDIKEKFADAVTRKRGSLRIKKLGA